jgi:polar amino acid transport system substrate-binding protein
MPSKRILHTIQKDSRFASIGWFKTKKRLNYAEFSLPIYESKPIVALIKHDNLEKFNNYRTLKALLNQRKLKTFYIAGQSMGEYADNLLSKHPHSAHAFSGTTVQLVRMLHHNHIDYLRLRGMAAVQTQSRTNGGLTL